MVRRSAAPAGPRALSVSLSRSMFFALLGATFAAGLFLIPGPALATGPIATEDIPPGVTYRLSLAGIHEYELENGLRVLLFPDPSQPKATVNITHLVGSRHENYGETGMAHLLEHLVFQGTPDHPNIPDELTAHGARPNGSTWFDRTNYFETFAATEENLDWALDLEADRMVNSFIAQEDLDSEMTVVRNEFEIGENNPRSILEERVYATAFLWHNYGNTTIGSRSDIESVPIERLKGFYKKWYRPDNAVLVVAGKIDLTETLKKVHREFGPIPVPDVPMQDLYTVEPPQDGARTVTLRRVGDFQVAMAAYHIPSGAHPDYAPLAVLSELLTDAPRGRLHKALVETEMATRVSGGADRFQDAALFTVTTEVPKEGDIAAVRDDLLAILEGFAENPPTDDEIEWAKTALLRDWERRQRNTTWAAIGLSEWAALGDWRLMHLHRDRLKEVTTERVLEVATAYLREANRTVGLYLPTEKTERVEVPATPPLDEMLAGYEGGEALAQGEAFDPSPENIEAHLVRKTIDPGLSLVMLPKKTRGEMVQLRLDLHLGDESSLEGRRAAGDFTGTMLMRGTTSRSREEIAGEIDRL